MKTLNIVQTPNYDLDHYKMSTDYSLRPTKDVTLSFLVCPTKDVTFPFLEKVLSHMNIKIIFSLSI